MKEETLDAPAKTQAEEERQNQAPDADALLEELALRQRLRRMGWGGT